MPKTVSSIPKSKIYEYKQQKHEDPLDKAKIVTLISPMEDTEAINLHYIVKRTIEKILSKKKKKKKSQKYARDKKSVNKSAFASNKIWTPLRGSRLGYILAEIKSDFGSRDATLKNLVDKALSGSTRGSGKEGDVFTAIRDRLKLHAKIIPPAVPDIGATAGVNAEHARRRTRAKDLVNSYNWHRMSDAIQLDELVHDYVHSIAKAHIKDRALREASRRFSSKGVLKDNPAAFESAKNTPNTSVGAFWNGLRNHIQQKMPNLDATKKNYSDDMVDRSLRRLALIEEQNEDVKNTKSDYHNPRPLEKCGSDVHWKDYLSWLPASESTTKGSALGTGPKTNVEQYARVYVSALPEKYGLVDKVKSLFGSKDATPVINGIRFRSHPAGKYDVDNAAAAIQEIDALKMALEHHSIIPPQSPTESNKDYANRANATVGSYLPAVRAAAHADTLGLGSYYNKTADKIKKIPMGSDISEMEKGERQYLPDSGVGKFELASAVSPLVRKVATDRGDIIPKFMVTNPVHPTLPEEEHELDLANVPDEEESTLHKLPEQEKEAGAAELLHKMDAENKGLFGAGRKPYEVVDDIHDDTPLDFDLPNIGKSSSIEEVEAYDPRARLKEIIKKTKKRLRQRIGAAKAGQRTEVNQFIANSLHKRGTAESILDGIQKQFNVTSTVASKLYENFKKLKNKPTPTNMEVPAQKKRMKKRKYSRPKKKSTSWVGKKIKKLLDEGYEQKQAVAIALNMAGRSKYGRAPKADIHSFFEVNKNESVLQPSNSDPIFADKLGDYDDPREELVRRDLKYREHPKGWMGGYTKHRKELEAEVQPEKEANGFTIRKRLKDGTTIKLDSQPTTKHKLVEIHWGPSTEDSYINRFEAVFTRAEALALYKKLMAEEKHSYSKSKYRKDVIAGGLGDKLSESDVNEEQLRMGIKVEMEHTKDTAIAKEIALDHLVEDPSYYSKLKLIEDKKTSSKYARVNDPTTYNALIKEAKTKKDPTALGVLADHLEEQNQPGAKLARAGMQAADAGRNPFEHHRWFNDYYHSPLYTHTSPNGSWPFIDEDGQHNLNGIKSGGLNISPRVGKKPGLPANLLVTQAHTDLTPGSNALQYAVPVLSKNHLRELIEDLPSIQGNTIWDLLSPHLPEEPDKFAAYRAPVDTINDGIVYPAGTFLPDPNKFSKKPKSKTKKKTKSNSKIAKVKKILLKIFPADSIC